LDGPFDQVIEVFGVSLGAACIEAHVELHIPAVDKSFISEAGTHRLEQVARVLRCSAKNPADAKQTGWLRQGYSRDRQQRERRSEVLKGQSSVHFRDLRPIKFPLYPLDRLAVVGLQRTKF
jgi:hypothetical protein